MGRSSSAKHPYKKTILESEAMTGLGRRVYGYRIDRGLTQWDVAKHCGCTISYISHIEHGCLTVSLPMLLMLTQVLGVTPNELLGIEDEKRRVLDEAHVEGGAVADSAGDGVGVGRQVSAIARRQRRAG